MSRTKELCIFLTRLRSALVQRFAQQLQRITPFKTSAGSTEDSVPTTVFSHELLQEAIIETLWRLEAKGVLHYSQVYGLLGGISNAGIPIRNHVEFNIAGKDFDHEVTAARHLQTQLRTLQHPKRQAVAIVQPQASTSSTEPSGAHSEVHLRLVPYASPIPRYWVGRNDSFSCYSVVTPTNHAQRSDEVSGTRHQKLWDKSFETGFDCWAADPASGVLVVFDFLLHSALRIYTLSTSAVPSLSRTVQIPRFPQSDYNYTRFGSPELALSGETVAAARYAHHQHWDIVPTRPCSSHLLITLVNWNTGEIIVHVLREFERRGD